MLTLSLARLRLGYPPAAGSQRRLFSSSVRLSGKRLKIGFVPEHFSTPLYFAKKHFKLDAELLPYPAGTGHMIQSLKREEIDVGIGLTEAWVAGLAREKEEAAYRLVGSYVQTPLCWAISTGAKRELTRAEDLKGKKCGISRFGSGSHVMSFVLADKHGWLSSSDKAPFDYKPLENFKALREGVTSGDADFFMWEYFTSKRYYDSGEIKQIGEIYTPWPSWLIVARDPKEKAMQGMSDAINQGIAHFNKHREEAVEYISTELDYSKEDAEEWYKGVQFVDEVRGVDPQVVEKTLNVLGKAGIIDPKAMSSDEMIAIKRAARAAT